MAQQQLLGQGFLIVQVSRTYSDTTHCVGLLWTRGQPDAEKKKPQDSQETRLPWPSGFRTRSPSKRAAADPRLRPRGHWDGHPQILQLLTYIENF